MNPLSLVLHTRLQARFGRAWAHCRQRHRQRRGSEQIRRGLRLGSDGVRKGIGTTGGWLRRQRPHRRGHPFRGKDHATVSDAPKNKLPGDTALCRTGQQSRPCQPPAAHRILRLGRCAPCTEAAIIPGCLSQPLPQVCDATLLVLSTPPCAGRCHLFRWLAVTRILRAATNPDISALARVEPVPFLVPDPSRASRLRS